MMRTLLKVLQNTHITSVRWTSRLTSGVSFIETFKRETPPWPKIHRCQFCGNATTGKAEVSESIRVAELKERAVLQVTGSDAGSLLQGLITNDVEILEDGGQMRAMYTMFLNAQGRVLYDTIIYHQKDGEKGSYLIECDAHIISDLTKHLRMYKLRKKVDFRDISSEFKVWCLFDKKPLPAATSNVWVPDPRLNTFMHRAVAPINLSASEIAGETAEASGQEYRRHRYQLGLAEGVTDLPPGEVLPLEANLVFLNGVDFNKGCYLGQELTARTHHTGVIRKRFMPVEIKCSSEVIPAGSAIKTEKGKNAGKFRSQSGSSGLALLRVAYGGGETLHVNLPDGVRCEMVAHVPPWWPREVLH